LHEQLGTLKGVQLYGITDSEAEAMECIRKYGGGSGK